MRIMSVIGALALAMCLAFPATAGPPANAITFDEMAYHLAVAPAFDAVHAADAINLDVIDLAAIASTGAAEKAANCSDSPAWVGIDTPDGIKAERLPACNPRRYDPGWLVI